VTTPTVELALKHGARLECSEAYIARDRARWLRSIKVRLKAARDASKDGSEVGAVVEAAIKGTYAYGVEYFNLIREAASEEPGELHRPDVRDFVVAQSRVNLIRQMAKARDAGAVPLAAITDALYVASDEPDSRALGARLGLPMSDRLGDLKPLGAVPMAELIERTRGLKPRRAREVLVRLFQTGGGDDAAV
jgi:hypothetical protein